MAPECGATVRSSVEQSAAGSISVPCLTLRPERVAGLLSRNSVCAVANPSADALSGRLRNKSQAELLQHSGLTTQHRIV